MDSPESKSKPERGLGPLNDLDSYHLVLFAFLSVVEHFLLLVAKVTYKGLGMGGWCYETSQDTLRGSSCRHFSQTQTQTDLVIRSGDPASETSPAGTNPDEIICSREVVLVNAISAGFVSSRVIQARNKRQTGS